MDAPFEETMLAAQTLEQAWHVIVGWGLPTSDAQETLLVRQLETVQMELGEDPRIYFARVDKLLNTLKSVGIVKEKREIVRIIIRNLSDEYMVEKRSYPLTMPNISRFEVEETVRASYANRKYSDLGKLSVAVLAKAPPPVVINDPHALAVDEHIAAGTVAAASDHRHVTAAAHSTPETTAAVVHVHLAVAHAVHQWAHHDFAAGPHYPRRANHHRQRMHDERNGKAVVALQSSGIAAQGQARKT